MRYDLDDVALRVEARKNKFKAVVAVCAIVIIVAILFASFYPETTVVFLCTLAIIGTVVYFGRFVKRNNPIVTFSKGFCGVNVKEHEYVTGGTRMYKYGGLRYKYHPSRHKGDVYIRCDNDEIIVVTALPKKHLDIFEIGDTLVCYPGTRYPNVDSREVKEQPCPLCGYVNVEGQEECSSCGLKILQKRK